jgi:DNA-binding SARP family transcriptional activator/tetratricopeptide (TPR) repeat protein
MVGLDGENDMIYRLLGELQIGDNGNLIRLPGGLNRILLAALVVRANQHVPKTALIREVWGTDDVDEAQLYKRVNQVRDLLGQVGRHDDIKTHSSNGYELHVETGDVDALLFQQLVAEAGKAQEDRRHQSEITRLWTALRLWRGPHPLSNVPSDAFVHEVVALEERRKRAGARLFDLEIAFGNYEGILDQLVTVSSLYPSDRRLCEQVMLTQYRCGHPGDATEAYELYQATVEAETGKPPDPRLRDLHFAIAREDEEAIAEAEARVARRAGVSVRPIVAVPRQLPRPVELIGRDEPVAEVTWLLGEGSGPAVPVVVISGPGGIGKTALAVQAAHAKRDSYPDGQLYVELHGTTGEAVDTSEVLAQILRAFGVPDVPKTKEERLGTYRTLLADRRVVIVLDDAADGIQVVDLLPPDLACAVLVTARQRLPEIRGAHHVAPLEPLEPADATELFLRVVSEASISLDSDADAIGRVVKLCGGLPLALHIAGALRVHDYTRPTSALADRLDRQGTEGLEYGELSVARSIGASFERLPAAVRRLLLELGLLPLTSFGLWTAAALLGGGWNDAGTAVSQLTARFLAEPVEQQERYRFHDLTREYVHRRALDEYTGDCDAVPSRAYHALLTLARRAHAQLYGGDFEVVHSAVPDWEAPAEALAEVEAGPFEWFEQERANIRAAITHCAELGLTSICWDLAVSVHEFYTIQGHYDDWYSTHTVALAACRQADDKQGEGVVLACLNQPALVASRRVSSTAAVSNLHRAVGLLAECGDRHGQAIALRTLGNALRRQGHIGGPLTLFSQALDHYTASGDTLGRWQTLRFTGQALLDRGDHDGGLRALEHAQALAQELNSERVTAQTQYWIGRARLATGDTDGAQAAFDVVYDIFRDDRGLGHAYATHGLGDIAIRRGSRSEAERNLAIAADLAREGGDAVLEGFVSLSAADLHAAQREPTERIAALRQAAAVFGGCGAAYLEMHALAALAHASAHQGDAVAADQAWTRVVELWDAAKVPAEDRLYRRPDA